MKDIKKYCAEFLGTFILTFIGTSAAVIFGGGAGGVVSILGISIAFGLTIIAIYYSIGHISGGHVNPAVSLAMYFDNRVSLKEMCLYMVSQLLGAIAGSGLLAAILLNIPNAAIKSYGLGQNGYLTASAVGLKLTGAILVEIILTCLFVLVVISATSNDDYKQNGGLIIGGTLSMVHLVGVALTGTSVNPARSLAPALVLLAFNQKLAISQVWVFILAPFIGAILAVGIWKLFQIEK